MNITDSALASIYTTFSLLFQQGYTTTETFYQRLCREFPSSGRQNVYGWMAQIPTMEEWLGDRTISSLAQYAATIVNKDWHRTIEVDRDDILDDQMGVYAPAVEMLGHAARKNPDYLLVSAMRAGESTNCYDGQYFFDTDHPTSKFVSATGSQSNYFTSTALTRANFVTVRAAMRAYVSDNGKPFNVRPNVLAVPPQLEDTGRKILVSEFIEGAGGSGTISNPTYKMAELLVIDELGVDATTWYLLDTTKPIKPFVYQLRQAAKIQAMINPNDPNVFNHKKFKYGVDSRENVGYGLWPLAAKAIQ